MYKLNFLIKIAACILIFNCMYINNANSANLQSNTSGNWSSDATWFGTLTGTINASTSSTSVTGNGTTFTTELAVGMRIITSTNVVVGIVASIQSNTALTLQSNAAVNMSSANIARYRKVPTTADNVTIINHNITIDVNAFCNALNLSATTNVAASINLNNGSNLTVTNATTLSTPPANTTNSININSGTFTTGSLALGGSTSTRKTNINVGQGVFDCLGNVSFATGGTTSGTGINTTNVGAVIIFRGSIVNFTFAPGFITTIKYLGVGAQTVRAATYDNLVLQGGTKTFQTTTTVDGSIEFIGGVGLSGSYLPTLNTIFKFTNFDGLISNTLWPATISSLGGVIINTTGSIKLNGAKSLPASGINIVAGNLNTDNQAISIGGNLSIGTGASITAGSSNFTFNGSGNQNIDGFTTTGSIIINKSSGRATFNGTMSAGPLNITTSSTGEASFGDNTNLSFTTLTINTGSKVFGGNNNSVTFSGNGTNAATFTPETSTITWTGTSRTVPPLGYYNLIFNGNGTYTFGAGGTANYNNFSMISTGGAISHTVSNSTVINGTLSIGASATLNTGIKDFTTNGANNIEGTFTIGNSTTAISLKHVYVNAGGTFNNSVNNPTTITGDFSNLGTATMGTGNYTFSGAGFQLSGNISIANMNITGTYFNAGTLTVNTSLSGAGTLNNNATGTININTSTAPTITTFNCSISGNTVNYSLAGNQTLRNTTYHHLNLTNSGTKNFPSGSISINGNLTISGTVSSQLVAATTIGGNVTLQNTSSFNTSTQNLTIGGNISNVAGSTLTWGTGIITLNGNSQSISNGNGNISINNLILSNGEKTFNNNLTVGTAFTINSGAKFVFGSSTTLTLNGSISGTGTIKAKACGGANNTLTIGGTSNGNSITMEPGFQHLSQLVVNKTSGIIIFADDVAIATALTLPTTGTAQITFNDDLNLYGTISITSGSAKINMGTTSSLSIGGCVITGTALTIPSNIFNGNPNIAGLFLNRTNGLTLGNQMISISDIVQISVGNLNTNNNLTLISTASKTARVAPIPVGASVSGNVVAERFIPGGNGKRKWRFLSSPINVGGSIALTQFQDDIYVTAPAEAAGGFDVNPFSNNASIRTYDESIAGSAGNGWTDPTNINNTIETGQGMEVFVRGSRNLANPYLNWTVPDNVTIDYVGTLNTGTITRNLSFTNSGAGNNDGFNLVGNPYASPINFDTTGITKTNIENKFWTYNPNTTLYGSYNAANGESINGMSKYISSGQAFFVRTTGAGASISFTENCKSIDLGNNYFKGLSAGNTQGKYPSMKITLTNSYFESDETLLIHDNLATKNGNDETDMFKFFNDELNIYFIADDNARLAMHAIPFNGPNDTSKLAVWSFDTSSVSVAKHVLNFSRLESIKPSIHIYLRDKFSNKMIDIRQQSVYEFEITNNTSSYGNNRFEIILSTELLTGLGMEKESNMNIYPNPFSSSINIQLNSNTTARYIQYYIYDLSGRLILIDNLQAHENKMSIETNELIAGTYLIKIITDKEIITEKIIKQ